MKFSIYFLLVADGFLVVQFNRTMRLFPKIIVLAAAVAASACSSSDTSESSGVDLANTGAMVSAVFSATESAGLHLVAMKADTEAGDTNTCEGAGGGPSNVTTTLTGTAGTYGSASNPAVITDPEAQFCEDSEGNINTNSEDLLFASFTLSSATITCNNGVTATMSGSGISRNRDDLGFFPQIYGTFTIVTTQGTGEARCSIFLNEESAVAEASCTDSVGNEVSLTNEIPCTIDAGDEAVPSDPAGENG